MEAEGVLGLFRSFIYWWVFHTFYFILNIKASGTWNRVNLTGW